MDMSAVLISMHVARRDAGSALPGAPVLDHRPARERARAAALRIKRLWRRP